MTVLLPEQAQGLRDLQGICRQLAVDVVLVGAIAYRIWMPDENRLTEDVDAVVGLDLDEFPRLIDRLAVLGWRQDERREHRWHSPGGARFDLLPVGPKARRERRIIWPRAETTMTVVGFEHVFADAAEYEVAPRLTSQVAPLVVLALLKIVSYLDDPHTRRKDLQDLVALMRRYEEDGDRRFGDDVLDAGVEYEEAGAFLLGRDLRTLCTTSQEVDVARRFLQQVCDPDFQIPIELLRVGSLDEDRPPFVRQFAALARGFIE